MITYRAILLRKRNVSDKSRRENKTHILCSTIFFRKSCRLWDNVEKYGRAGQATDDNIIRRMRFACWITKATNTYSEYVILIAFPRQQWLRERASMLRFYAHFLSCCLHVTHSSFSWAFHATGFGHFLLLQSKLQFQLNIILSIYLS
jgi:hypothetical protein